METIQTPHFTVLMSLYANDDPRLFSIAIDSVFKNSLLPEELLLVIDGPIPIHLQDLVSQYQTKYEILLRVINLPVNLGLAAALNTGLKFVFTDWVIRADADDYNLPNRFELLCNAINANPSLDLIGSNILEVDEIGNPVSVRKVPESYDDISRYIVSRNPFNHMSVAFKKKSILDSGGYPSIYLREDYALWCQLLVDGRLMCNLGDILVHATTGLNMINRRGGLKYALGEIALQRYLYAVGIKGIINAIFHGLIRSTIFLLPLRVRASIYKNFLRIYI